MPEPSGRSVRGRRTMSWRAGSAECARTSGPSRGNRRRSTGAAGPACTRRAPTAGGVRRVSLQSSPRTSGCWAIGTPARSDRAVQASPSADRSARSCHAGRSSDSGRWTGPGNTVPPSTRTRPRTSAMSGRCCASMWPTSHGGRTSSPFRTRRTGPTIQPSGPVRAGARASSRPHYRGAGRPARTGAMEIFERLDFLGPELVAVHPRPNENAWLLGYAYREKLELVGARGVKPPRPTSMSRRDCCLRSK